MVATTQWDFYDDELETLVMKLNYHACFLTSAADTAHAEAPDTKRLPRHGPNPVEPAHRPWEGSWNRYV